MPTLIRLLGALERGRREQPSADRVESTECRGSRLRVICHAPCRVTVASPPLTTYTPMAYNTHMIFLETRVFTNRIRWSGSGRGKRGGSRLIYYWDFGDRILMLYVYQKNERENLTEEQKVAMRKIAEAYKHE